MSLDDILSKVLRFVPYPWQAKTLQQFQESDRDFAICAGRQSGKTHLCATYGVAETIRHEFPYRIGIIAQSKDAASEMFIPVSHYIEANELLWWCVKRMTRSEIEFDTGTTIQVKPSGYRGAHFNILFIDEAAHHEDNKIEAIEPAIMAKHGRIIAISTPNGRRGWFYNKYTEPGEKTIKLWYPSSANPNITAEQLEHKRLTKAKFWFEQEYLAKFIDWSGNAFLPKEVMGMFDQNQSWHKTPKEGIQYKAGLDLGASGQDETIFLIGHELGGYIILDHYAEYSGEPYQEQILGPDGIYPMLQRFSVSDIAIDAMGAGEGVIGIFPAMNTQVEPVKQSIQWHASAYLDVKYYLETSHLKAPNEEPGHAKMEKQLIDLIMKQTEYGRRPIHPEGEHDDTYSALALLIHTYYSPQQNEPLTVTRGKSRY
jgi:hypothetical protein